VSLLEETLEEEKATDEALTEMPRAPSTSRRKPVNKNYLLLRALRKVASVGDLFVWLQSGCSERLVYSSAATNSTPSLTELATIHSTVYSSRVPVGDGLRSIDIYRNAA
jgi:hypothetical protein